MKKLLIIDLESTCFERGKEPKNFFSEIIEIGGVLLNLETNKIEKKYDWLIKPVLFPSLSPFCTNLTTLTQAQIDQGVSIQTAMQELVAEFDATEMVFCSWGFYDRKQFESVCRRFSLPYPFGKDHISLKHNHAKFYEIVHHRDPKGQPVYKGVGMEKALRKHQLPLTGTHHRGNDDALNIAQIALQMASDGWRHRLLA